MTAAAIVLQLAKMLAEFSSAVDEVVLCNVDATKDDLLHLGGQRTYAVDYARDHGGRDPPLQEWHENSKDWDDLGDDMHSFVSFRVRNGETES